MGSWTIYSKNGVAKAVVKELELHDEWMAECFLTVTINSATPIQFGVGDYLDYRGERYTIEYDPNVIKRATSGTYGEGFVYDGIKFVGSQDEIVRCDFNDIVLSDNDVHYTALPIFPFYCESVDDLLDRIQANLEDLYPNQWIVIGLNTVRNSQRGSAVGRQTAFENAYKKWIDPDMTPHTDPYGKQSVAESADNITCWDALAKVHEDFGLNFIVRGKVVVVGTAGVFTANTFRYGKGNGLTEIEKVGDSSQQIVTRLRAYGSETNLPLHYYSAINMLPYGNVVAASDTGLFQIDVAFKKEYFVHEFSSGETDVVAKVGDVSYNAKAYINSTTGNININIQTAVSVAANAKVYITEGVKRDMWPNDHKDYSQDALPENMAVSRLMLPMFPNTSLYDWVKAHRDTGTEYDDTTGLATYHGITAYFSKEPHRPYIDSLNKAQYGVRPASIYFDGSNETDDIHPTIEGMTYNNVRIDAVYAADQIEDSGVYDDSTVTVPNFHITLPDLGFNLAEVYEENASIDMKDGMCGGRSFKFASKPTQDSNGRWVCEVQRDKDENLNLFFPYCDFQITSGDHYVLTGIQMPDAYIEAAAVKLLGAALDALQKNEAPRFTYQPKIDKNFMQRQHDTASASQSGVSLHDTLKAGDVFVFADADMGIDASIIIDVLTIKENGDNGIPTYEILLRDEKQVSTIQKIQNKIDSVINGAININSGVGGLTAQQVRSLINNYGGEQFISKLNDDTAQGYLTMLKGLQIGASFIPDILGEGGVLRMRADGKVELVTDILYARMKAYFDTVEIREYQHTGGNRIASVAGNRMCRVEWYNSSNQVLEKTSANLSSVAYFRCYFRAEDDETEVKNNWVVGDLAYCHVTSITNSSDNPEQKGLNQKHLWRLVIGRNTEGTLTADGEAYIDLSNRSTETISGTSYTGYQSGSDVPDAQDDIIQLGNVNDTTRQGAIVEFVTGTDAPSYQIFQNINGFSLSGKNQIGFGYNTSTGRAYLNVFGDFRFGARPNTSGSYMEYNSTNGTLNIKAHVEFTNSDSELDTLVQAHQRDDSYDDTQVRALISGLQSQIDGQIETWFYDYMPVSSIDSKVPLVNITIQGQSQPCHPYYDWYTADGGGTASETTTERIKHLGDTFYDNTSGYAFRFSRNESTNAFEWVVIEDSAVITALQNAARAQDTADHKRRIFVLPATIDGTTYNYPYPPYDVGDMWVNAVYPTTGTKTYDNDILKCVTAKTATQAFAIADWTKASDYTNDDKVNSFISELLNGASDNEAAMTAAFKAIRAAMNAGVTSITGGLILSNDIELRDTAATPSVWSGISGMYDSTAQGGGVAIWAGGARGDWEAYYNSLTPAQQESAVITTAFAKSLFRFDGSGYLAGGNITWNANGAVTIKDVTNLYDDNDTDVLNELTKFSSAFHFTTQQSGDTETIVNIIPQYAFSDLYIYNSGGNKHVATEDWVTGNFISKTWFSNFLKVHYKDNGTDTILNPNEDFPQDATDKTLESVLSFWTNYGITALGQGNDGSTVVSVLDDLNDVHLVGSPSVGQVLTYENVTGVGNRWTNKAPEIGGYPVLLTSITDGQVLKFDGTNLRWVNGTGGGSNVGALNDLSDVTITSLADKDILQYDYANSAWKNVTLSTALAGYATQSWVQQQGYLTSISAATSNALGGIKVGYTTSGKNYKVQLDASNNAYVNVPWENTTYDLSGYLQKSGGTMTGILTTAKIRINTLHSSSSKAGGIYYYNGSTDYLLIGQGTSNLWIGSNETSGNHHLGSTYISAGEGSLYCSRLVNGSRNNYEIIDAGNIGSQSVNYASSAGAVAWSNVSNRPTNVSSFTNDSGYITSSGSCNGATYLNTRSVSASDLASTTGCFAFSSVSIITSGNDYVGLQLDSGVDKFQITAENNTLYFRQNDYGGSDSSHWRVWTYFITSETIDSQSVNYANSAGSAVGVSNVGEATSAVDRYIWMAWSDNTYGYLAYKSTLTFDPINGILKTNRINTTGRVVIDLDNDADASDPNSGSLRIGTATGQHILIDGNEIIAANGSSTSALYIQYNGGTVDIGGAGSVTMSLTGNFTASGGVTALSDIRHKSIVSDTRLQVTDIARMRAVRYLWNDGREDNAMHVGSIAQDWQQILPEVVLRANNDEGTLSLQYGVAALISSITIARKVVDHERRITELEKECAAWKEAYKFLKKDYEELRLKIA